MEAFKEAWLTVDREARGSISADQLAGHLRSQGYEDGFINKWLRVFDADDNGNISVDSFCDVLGFNANALMQEARQRASRSQQQQRQNGRDDNQKQQQQQQQPDDAADADDAQDKKQLPIVEFISGDMDKSWQDKIVEICMEGLEASRQLKEAPKWIKSKLDQQFGQLWHVVMLNGQFWCYYGHEPGFSFAFKHGQHIFVIYKTPAV